MTMTETPRPEGDAARVVRPNRFINASAEHIEPFWDTGAQPVGTAFNNIEVAANGYLRGILLTIQVSNGGSNSATPVLAADGPWNIIQSIRLADINGANIIGPISGYDLELANKYGGYSYGTYPQTAPFYSVSAGSGTNAGSFQFMIRVPVQINPRDAYGSLPNMNAASTFKLFVDTANSSEIWSTAPSNASSATVRIRASIETWLVPQAVDSAGVPNSVTPPGLGTYQRWVKNVSPIVAGTNTVRLPNVSNLIRNLVFVNRSSAGARDGANFPRNVEFRIDGYARDQIAREQIIYYMFERNNYNQTQIDTGVYAWQFTHELDGKAGYETRELWLPTNSATRLELVGDWGAGGSLEVLTNDVVIAGGDYREAG